MNGLDINRNHNGFITEYTITRGEDELRFQRKETKEDKDKREQMEQQIELDNQVIDTTFKTNKEKSYKQQFKEKVGTIFSNPFDDTNLGIRNRLMKYQKKKEQLILIEDFFIKTDKQLIEDIKKNESVDEQQEQGYYIRTASKYEYKENPIVRISRNRTLVDIDMMMLGNPPLRVREFI